MDGSSRGKKGNAGGGLLIRDESGGVVAARCVYFGIQTNVYAEIHALLEGLHLCLEFDLWNVEVETDSKLLVDSLCSGNWPWYLDAAMLQVKDKLYTSRLSVCHIYREANSAADFIAKWASTTCSSEHL